MTQSLSERICILESRVRELRNIITEQQTTINDIAAALIETQKYIGTRQDLDNTKGGSIE